MRFYRYLNEDVGEKGKKFEKTLMKAFDLLQMKYVKNSKQGKYWDVYADDDDEGVKRLNNKKINIKIHGTKTLFGNARLGRIIPGREEITPEDLPKHEKMIKNYIKQEGIHNVYFLSAKSKDIQKKITDAVQNENIEELDKLVQKKNFNFYRLGDKFKVKLTLKDNNTIGYSAIGKNGKVGMYNDPPRKVGGSKNFISYRTGTIKTDNRKIKKE